ncbi:hypothetical protein IAR55_001704 [Kwoniella newhampshirensis]|uniref:Raptor N-terminal CASPase-like domain-containing protein n=1 Tax=Kwoniella newhampshirensis TaxID=1651941 RepID=A0AAW0Z2V5_9TREE
MQPPPSLPSATFQRINSSMPRLDSITPSEGSGSGWVTTSSWGSTRGTADSRVGRPTLAWAGVRHRVDGEEKGKVEMETDRGDAAHCSQAVLFTCLHLSHEMALREVGLYAWMAPDVKDPLGSMTKIMKKYIQQVKTLSNHAELQCRSAPDPSKSVIQHHLQKARLAAGPNSYVAVIYNGHGIQEPPTEAGELWCYDRDFDDCLRHGGGPSEYIPIMLFDLLTWAGASTCYVWDCQHAGRFIRAAQTEAEQIDTQLRAAAAQDASVAEQYPAVYARRQIHFAACGPNQSAPKINGMPDDLFTACLLSPLRIALLFHNLQTFPLTKGDGERYVRKRDSYMSSLWDNMSQELKDRLWYELAAIVHTIAWQTLEGAEYQQLFGKSGDVVNNLAVGFILSRRVMGAYRIVPESIPPIPSTTGHALWTTWDLIMDNLFEQLPKYFDEGVRSTVWEKDLKLVSFLADQLESITTSSQIVDPSPSNTISLAPGGSGSMSASLTRLPIICAAAMTSKLRVQACQALDSCLRGLDRRGLIQAVQGGALDVAARLLDLRDETISGQSISIWASLARYDRCVLALNTTDEANASHKEIGLKAEGLTELSAVKFFLEALQSSLSQMDTDIEDSSSPSDDTLHQDNQDPGSDARNQIVAQIIQTAAILSTISSFVTGCHSPRLVIRTLSMSRMMLRSASELIRQWGALLIGQVLGSLDRPEEGMIVDVLRDDLLSMISGPDVESRATAIYALTRWVSIQLPFDSGMEELDSILDMSERLVRHTRIEGSPLVRKELARMFINTLELAGEWTKMTMWTFMVQQMLPTVSNSQREEIKEMIKKMGKRAGVTTAMSERMIGLLRVITVLKGLYHDPDAGVATIVKAAMEEVFRKLVEPATAESEINSSRELSRFVFSNDGEKKGTNEMIDVVLDLAKTFLQGWAVKAERHGQVRVKVGRKHLNTDLFHKTKLALQAYLTDGRRNEIKLSSSASQKRHESTSTQEKTWTLRHRVLEDSLVIAEQQVGLPWQWAMKDITSPDPWTTITCHSFGSTVMSCNKTHDLLLWDWSTSRKTGHVDLDLPPNAAITSARFVNELHEQTVILAEINNGDIHILSGSQHPEPSLIKPIACFRALDLLSPLHGVQVDDADDRKLVTSWFRTKGQLIVGGASGIVNVWDAPAERCVQTLETNSQSVVTTLITEPVSGNLIFAGLNDGQIKLYDLRQSRRTALLSWAGDGLAHHNESGAPTGLGRGIMKVGVVLGESKNVTSACSNGIVNVFDLRHLNTPTSSLLVHPDGIASASFQAHSGLMSTISNVCLPSSKRKNSLCPDSPSKLSSALSHLRLLHKPKSESENHTRSLRPQPDSDFDKIVTSPETNFALHRSTLGSLTSVTEETIHFPPQEPDVNQRDFRPYTAFHPLRPFLGIGYGRNCYLRGCGVGKGDDTDSGSYSFLRAHAKFRA